MKGIVPDLVVGAHGEDRLPGRFQSRAIQFAVCGLRGGVEVSIRTLVCQTCRELLPEEFGDRRCVSAEACKSGTQSTFTRRGQLTADGILVMQIERAQ